MMTRIATSTSISTGIGQRRTKYLADDSPYRGECQTVIRILDQLEESGISAAEVATTIVSAIEAEKPKSFYARGSNASLVFALRRLAPRGVVETITAKKFGLSR